MNVAPSTAFEAVCDFGVTGLTPGVRILDNAGATTTARVTAGISEYPAGSGIYYVSLTAPATAGQYTIAWDNGTQTAGNFATEDLLVGATLDSIAADLAAGVITVTSPVDAGGDISIVQGDDYANADGRALTWNLTGAPTLTGHAVKFRISGALEKDCTVVDADTVRVELTSAETAALAVKAYKYELDATISTRKVTLARGHLAVTANYTVP